LSSWGWCQRTGRWQKKYDQLAYDFIKISLTAYSLTAILGGILIFTFLTLYPAFFGYLSSIFRPVMHVYALMFVAESGTIYIYYYGWDKMKEGLLKWIHVSMSVVLNVIGTVLMIWRTPGSGSCPPLVSMNRAAIWGTFGT